MAFFCPAFPKSRTNSIESLNENPVSRSAQVLTNSTSFVFSKPTLLCVTNNFEPTVDDELRVQRGDLVTGVYREEDWIFVVLPNGNEGFIPALYTENVPTKNNNNNNDTLGRKKEIRAQNISYAPAEKKKIQHKNSARGSLRKVGNQLFGSLLRNKSKSHQSIVDTKFAVDENSLISTSMKAQNQENTPQKDMENSNYDSNQTTLNVTQFINSLSLSESPTKPSPSPTCHFRKKPQGRVAVVFSFIAHVEDDLTVNQGQMLTILNQDDPDWFWVVDKEGNEGFVPSTYIVPLQNDRTSLVSCGSLEGGMELVVVNDINPQAKDDLKVMRGDVVYSNENPDECPGGWLWVYSPRTKLSGFVPVECVNKQ